MHKIKILHIIKSLGRGGAEMLLPETLKLHDHDRFEFHYIYFLPWKNQLVEELEQAQGKVTCLAAKNNFQLIAQYKKVSRYIAQHKIELIHCHLPWAGFLGRLIYRFGNVPVIYTEHNKQERYHQLTYRLNKWTYNWQSAALAVSKDVAASIQQHIKPTIPIKIVLNGVNTTDFQRKSDAGDRVRSQLNIPENAIIIGTVAVFRFQKRLSEWLEIMQQLCADNPHVYGLLVGDGPLMEELAGKRKALGLEDRVYMPGLQRDVKPWLAAIDIYMMSSIFEGLPIALLEAMSMECAIVSTDAGGIKEVLRSGENGLMVPSDEWENLGSEVQKLIDNAAVRLELAKQARAHVKENYNMSRMVGQLEEFYQTAAR